MPVLKTKLLLNRLLDVVALLITVVCCTNGEIVARMQGEPNDAKMKKLQTVLQVHG